MPVDWSPLHRNNAPAQAFERGMKIVEAAMRSRALKKFSDNPDDPDALNALIRVAPEVGFRAYEHQQRRRSDQRDQQFDGALSDYGNAMLGGGMSGGSTATVLPSVTDSRRVAPTSAEPLPTGPQAPNAMTAFAGANALAAPPSSSALGSMGGALATEAAAPQADPETVERRRAILAVTGKPQSRADAAFFRMLQIDPKRALEIDSKMRDRFMDRIKDEHDAFGYAVANMAGVADQSSYEQRRAEIIQRFAPLGMNIEAAIPEQFPGEDGLRDLRMRGLDLKDQLAALLNQDKAEAYIDNIDADNARADRNTDSLIRERSQRTGIARERAHDARTTATRRDVTTRRGQDMRGRGGRSGPVKVSSPEEARKLPPGTEFRTPDGRVMRVPAR